MAASCSCEPALKGLSSYMHKQASNLLLAKNGHRASLPLAIAAEPYFWMATSETAAFSCGVTEGVFNMFHRRRLFSTISGFAIPSFIVSAVICFLLSIKYIKENRVYEV